MSFVDDFLEKKLTGGIGIICTNQLVKPRLETGSHLVIISSRQFFSFSSSEEQDVQFVWYYYGPKDPGHSPTFFKMIELGFSVF